MTEVALVSANANPLSAHTGPGARCQQVYVEGLARALGGIGHRVIVYVRRSDRHAPDRVGLAPNVEVRYLRAGPAAPVDDAATFSVMDEFAATLGTALARQRAEIVHAHSWTSGSASLLAATPLGIPLVQTFHTLGSVQQRHQRMSDAIPPERLGVERRLVQQADRVIAMCSDEHRELEAMGCRGDRVAMVPAGFDAGVFRPRSDTRWFEVDRCARPAELIAVSGLVPQQGVGDVVRAVATLDDVRLTIVGGPAPGDVEADPDHRALRELARSLDVGRRVTFTGGLPPEHVADRLRRADLFVAAPWYESSGIAAVEAMACGLPVVGTAVGALLDTIVDGGTGTLVPPHDPAAFAAAIDGLASRPELRHELGSRAAWRAHRRYAWPPVARGIAEVYRRVCVGRPGRECRA